MSTKNDQQQLIEKFNAARARGQAAAEAEAEIFKTLKHLADCGYQLDALEAGLRNNLQTVTSIMYEKGCFTIGEPTTQRSM
jgi:hypothetical protein